MHEMGPRGLKHYIFGKHIYSKTTLLFLSQYLSYAFLRENFIHNGDGRAIPSNIYPVKYLYEPLLPYESFLTILFF